MPYSLIILDRHFSMSGIVDLFAYPRGQRASFQIDTTQVRFAQLTDPDPHPDAVH